MFFICFIFMNKGVELSTVYNLACHFRNFLAKSFFLLYFMFEYYDNSCSQCVIITVTSIRHCLDTVYVLSRLQQHLIMLFMKKHVNNPVLSTSYLFSLRPLWFLNIIHASICLLHKYFIAFYKKSIALSIILFIFFESVFLWN